MPLYEYHCPRCEAHVELLVRRTTDVAECPKCGHKQMERLLSVSAAPAIGGRSLPVAPPTDGGCGRSECASGRCMFGE